MFIFTPNSSSRISLLKDNGFANLLVIYIKDQYLIKFIIFWLIAKVNSSLKCKTKCQI